MEQVKSMSLAEIKAEMEANGTAPPKRKRGRPRKVKPEDVVKKVVEECENQQEPVDDKSNKKRGRPRKKTLPVVEEVVPEPVKPQRQTYDIVNRNPPEENSILSRFLNGTFMTADGTAPRERLSRPISDDECEMGIIDDFAGLEMEAKAELDNEEREALIEELSQLVIRNPEIMKLEANSTLREIKSLSLDELREKLLIARIHMSSNLNQGISNVVLNFANSIIGKTLHITDELKAETENDKYLRDALNEVMGVSILTKLPPHLKLGALYGSSVLSAYSKRRYTQPTPEKESD